MTRGWRAAVGSLVLLLVVATAAASDDTATVTGSVHVQPLTIDLSVSPQQVATGQRIHMQAVVHNRATTRIRDVTVTLHRPDGGLLIHPPQRHHLPNLHGGQSRELHWQGCADRPGSYGVLARAEVRTLDGHDLVVESPTRFVHVTHRGQQPCR